VFIIIKIHTEKKRNLINPMSMMEDSQAGFVPSRLRKTKAKDDEAPNSFGGAKTNERAILRSLSRNHERIGGRRRHSLASKGDFGQHFRNPLPIKPLKGKNRLFGVPAGSSAYDTTTVQPLAMDTTAAKPVDYVQPPKSRSFHYGQRGR
jgi:hypothetical protein